MLTNVKSTVSWATDVKNSNHKEERCITGKTKEYLLQVGPHS